MDTRRTIANDMAAEIAEDIRVELEAMLLKYRYKISQRAGDSFQSIAYWLLIAEATERH